MSRKSEGDFSHVHLFLSFLISSFSEKAVVFLVHEKGERERERGLKKNFSYICSSEWTFAKDQLEEFFQVHHCILPQVCE